MTLDVVRIPGHTDYAHAWALQRAVHAEVASGSRADTMLLLEHPRTITMGRRGGWDNLVNPPAELIERGFELWQIDRGGDITYHGPGQLVGYPIINMKRAGIELGPYLRNMEQSHIDLCAGYGIDAARVHGFTGVWCGNEKVTAIGVRVTQWTTMHGFALNVGTNLEDFQAIVACGLQGRSVTSLERKLGTALDFEDVARRLAERFASLFEYQIDWIDLEALPQVPERLVDAMRSDFRYVPEQAQPSVSGLL